MDFTKELQNLRQTIIEISSLAGEGHIPSSLSVLEIIFAYYSSEKEYSNQRSQFILSKGHASLGYFAVLEHFGYIKRSDLESFAKFDSILGGHPDRLKVPGVVASTGSLGHGLPFAVGMALANKLKSTNERILVLVGDGEMNEGSNWEAMLLAANHELNQLSVIVDSNKSSDRAVALPNLDKKFESFGFEVTTCNGHDINDLKSWLNNSNSRMPRVLIAETVKGHGFTMLENNPAWHHAIPNKDQVKEILRTSR